MNMASLKHGPMSPSEGYKRLEQAADFLQDLSSLRAAFCPIERDAMLEVVRGLIELYLRIAPPLTRKHGIDYATNLQRVMIRRLARQHGVS